MLAAIAAADAACCAAFGEHAQGESHHDAPKLVERIADGGRTAAQALKRAVAIKSKAQYGFIAISKTDYRHAKKLIASAKKVLER